MKLIGGAVSIRIPSPSGGSSTVFNRIRAGLALVLVAGAAAAAVGAGPEAAATGKGPVGKVSTPIQHVVFVMKENRSFDQYFGRFPGVNGSTRATCWKKDGSTEVIDPMPRTPDPMPQDISHTPGTFKIAYHGGVNDGWCHEYHALTPSGFNLAESQMYQDQIPNYWAYAAHYGIGDNMFPSWRGASFGNNVFQIAAQAGRYAASTNYRTIYGLPKLAPGTSLGRGWGCNNSADTTVDMMGLNGALSKMYPCFDFPTLPQTLSDNGISWKFYANEGKAEYIHASVNAINYLRCDTGVTTYPCSASAYYKLHVPPTKSIFTAAASGNLPAVSWFLPTQTEHPPKTACAGENSTVNLINALQSGPDWNSTAVVILWDEWGGYFDHVVPPTASGINANVSYGHRVPLLVISPWVRNGALSDGGTVDSTFYSHASLLRFVETNWSLPTLGAMDDLANYAPGEPVPGDFMNFFDFSDPLNPPKPGPFTLAARSCTALSPAQKALIAGMNPD